MVVSTQHPSLMSLVTKEQKKEVENLLKKIKSTSEKDIEELEKEGAFTGSYAINPINNKKVPVYAGNFVIADYGCGMVMAVPAHDDRDMAFVAVQINDEEKPEQIGVSRYVANPDGETVEFALAVADSWQKRGLGRKLMQVLIDCARSKGFSAVVGEVLSDNTKMLNLMSSLGFKILANPEDTSIKRVVKPLTH